MSQGLDLNLSPRLWAVLFRRNTSVLLNKG